MTAAPAGARGGVAEKMDAAAGREPPLVVTKAVMPASPAVAPPETREAVAARPATVALTPAALWERFMALSASKPSLLAAVESLVLERVEGGEARLVARDASALASAKPLRLSIEEVMSKAAGRTMRVELVLSADAEPAVRPPPMVDTAARAEAERHPLVRRAAEVLGARLVDVQDDESDRADAE